jgi:hypothetical protein
MAHDGSKLISRPNLGVLYSHEGLSLTHFLPVWPERPFYGYHNVINDRVLSD